MAKVDNLLAALRGEAPAEPEPVPALEAPPPQGAAPVDLSPLEQRIQELERRLAEQAAAPPAMEEPLEPPPPEPPQAPTELSMFLHTRMELLEKKLELAQQEALRSSLLLREREEAQRKAQGEVEDLFRNIREQQRSASYDRVLRQQLSSSQIRIREMEAKLSLAELRMIPAEDVVRHLETEEGRLELARRIREQLTRLESEVGDPGAAEKPLPPGPELIAGAEGRGAPGEPGPAARTPGATFPELSVVLGRVADLERRLEGAQKERDKEREARRHWEENILTAFQQTRGQWQKGGGPELLVEATLETLVDSIRQRDALQEETSKALNALRDEPPDSDQTPLLRASLAECQKRMECLQEKIDKQMAIVQAWVQRNKGKE
ncbi:hypothetical protein ACFL2T_03850 [Elusimicrobiota bacterium]